MHMYIHEFEPHTRLRLFPWANKPPFSSLLSTGWFQERIQAWFRNRTKINRGWYGRQISSFVQYRKNEKTLLSDIILTFILMRSYRLLENTIPYLWKLMFVRVISLVGRYFFYNMYTLTSLKLRFCLYVNDNTICQCLHVRLSYIKYECFSVWPTIMRMSD